MIRAMNGAALAGLCRAAKSTDKPTTASGLPPFALADRPALSALRGVDTSLRTPAPFVTSLYYIIGFHRGDGGSGPRPYDTLIRLRGSDHWP